MSKISAFVHVNVLLAGVLFGQSGAQSGEAAPAFQVADIHSSAHTMRPYMTGGVLRSDRYEIRNGTMVDMIHTAYDVDGDKILGGPSWLDTDRFDVIAKAPRGTSPDAVKLMLRALLADRFKLALHNDTKALPGFVLSLGKGKPKLKAADDSGKSGCESPPRPTTPPAPGEIRYNQLGCRNMTMEAFAQALPDFANAYLPANVVDQTGLKGAWDFDIKWTGRGQLAAAGADGISIFDAVDKQMGLKLEPQKVTLPAVVVDSVSRKPTENLPGVITSLPPRPPSEFEVADIKLTPPDFQGRRFQTQPGGRVNIAGFTLKEMIGEAWNLTDEMVADTTKWMETERFDIIAKATTDAGPGGSPDIDDDDLSMMLRKLLTERFKLTTHMEDRPVSGYVLTAVKPKLTKADPSGRTGCGEGPGPDGKDPRIANPVLSRLLNCKNMTMGQFAEMLPNLAGGYVRTPVRDSTGIDDIAFDFTLSFSTAGLVRNGGVPGQAAPASGAAGASDPNGALSLPDAISKQLGLKLELQKRPMPVLVVDRAEKPEN